MSSTTTQPPAAVRSTTLYFREGSSDKVYHAAIEARGNGHTVTFAYGRRGSTLNTGTKTAKPVSLAEATTVYDKLVASKLAKGYTPGADGTPYSGIATPDGQPRDTGVRCQLANAVEPHRAEECLRSDSWCAQQKFDGRRMLVRKDSGGITGINRRGLAVAIPEPIRQAVAQIPFDLLIDGEAVGDTLHSFDLLEVDGHDLRQRRYIDRFAGLMAAIPPNLPALRWVSTAVEPNDKVAIFEDLRQTNREGVVFKDMDAPYSPGRPASGGDWLKFKFVETASFIAGLPNPGKRSVELLLFPDGHRSAVNAGNVTIPPNHEIPNMGSVCEVQYLYALEQSGSVYQPVYLGPRSDIPADECVVSQLKFKPAATSA